MGDIGIGVNAYLMMGTVLFFFSLVLASILDGRKTSPASWFFLIFYMHAYLDIIPRLGIDPHFNEDSLPILIQFNLTANILLLFGYALTSLVFLKYKQPFNSKVEISVVFGRKEFRLTFFLILMLVILAVLILYLSGSLDESKGANAYSQFIGYSYYGHLISYLTYSLVPALFLSAFNDEIQGNRKYWFYIAFICISIFSFVQFGRQVVVFNLISILIIYTARVSDIRFTALVYLTAFMLVLSVFASFRELDVGITSLNIQLIKDYVLSDQFELLKILYMIIQGIPGQAVFSNTIEIMQGHDYFYGKTYLDSTMRAIIPFPKSIGYEPGVSPAIWYKDVYAPTLDRHGFDFGFFAEAYINFGIYGTLVFSVLGIVLSLISKLILHSRSPVLIIFGAILIVNLMVGLRNDSVPLVTRAVFFIVPLLLWRNVLLLMVKSNRFQSEIRS